MRGECREDVALPDVDQLAADAVVLLGPRNAVQWARRFYAAMMRTAGQDAA